MNSDERELKLAANDLLAADFNPRAAGFTSHDS